jgi:hypothetical protein
MQRDAPEATYPLSEELVSSMDRLRRLALLAGLVGLAASGIGAVFDPAGFFRSYLVAYVFVVGIVLGSLALLMVQHLSGGAWGLVIRRVLESAIRTLPLVALLFLPIAAGVTYLYPWARSADVAASEILQHKRPYLNVPFFLARAALYFAVWVGVAHFLNKWSEDQDRGAAVRHERRFQQLSAPGLIAYAVTVTFMAVDWVMSLMPEWFSTIFGILIMGGQGLSALAFSVAVLFLLTRHRPLSDVVTPAHFHDLGKLLLGFVMLWAYFSFSQFLIVWSGNLPEEIPYYLRRMQGWWGLVSILLVVAHFALPFLLLLSRDLKQNATVLMRIAVFLIAMRFVDLFWVMAPAFPDAGPLVYVVDVLVLVGLGGLWLSFFARQLKARPLLPLNDPGLAEALQHHAGH